LNILVMFWVGQCMTLLKKFIEKLLKIVLELLYGFN
jgi:hypothetical protein